MSKYLQVGGLLICLGFFAGCSEPVADPAQSEFTGEDAKAQMKAMEEVGNQVDDTGVAK
jgi:hypothetical protein